MIETLKDYPIQLEQSLIWSDMDAYRHINNAVFFRYFEDVRMHCFEKLGVNEYMTENNLGPILASTQADFKAPLFFPDRITVGIRINDLQEKRFMTHYVIYSHKLETIVATGQGLVVYYDYHLNKSCPVPETIKMNIMTLMENI